MKTIAGMVGSVTVFGFAIVMDDGNGCGGRRRMPMTHTALTAEEEIRRLRVLRSARKGNPVFGDRREVPMFWNTHWEAPAHRALAEALACQNVLTPAPPRPTVVARAWPWLAALVRRLGRSPGDVVVGRAVPGSEPSVAK